MPGQRRSNSKVRTKGRTRRVLRGRLPKGRVPNGSLTSKNPRVRVVYKRVLLDNEPFTSKGINKVLSKNSIVTATASGKVKPGRKTTVRTLKGAKGSTLLAKVRISYRTKKGRRKSVVLGEGNQIISRRQGKRFDDFVREDVPGGILRSVFGTLRERQVLIEGYGARFLRRTKGKEIPASLEKNLPKDTRITLVLEGHKFSRPKRTIKGGRHGHKSVRKARHVARKRR